MSGFDSEVGWSMKNGCCLLVVTGHHCEKHDVLNQFYKNFTNIRTPQSEQLAVSLSYSFQGEHSGCFW